MMSFLDSKKGAPAPNLRLSRKGLVVVSVMAGALVVGLCAAWILIEASSESETLRNTIRTMEQKALAEKANDPKERRIAELEAQIQALRLNARHVLEASDAVVQSAAAMPEFKSPQYKEPYLALLKQIHEMNAAAQIPLTEGAQ